MVRTPASTSDAVVVGSGIPQWSVLCPVLFIAYIDPLKNIALTNVWMHQFSDDTQSGTIFYLRKTTNPHLSSSFSQDEGLRRLTECISRAEAWFTPNGVKLNIDKSLLFFSSTKNGELYHSTIPHYC